MRTETVTRLRSTPTEVGPDWSTPDSLPIQTLAPAEPWSSGDPEQSGSWGSYLSGWQLYLPEGADVTSKDRLEVRGQTFTPVREPIDWANAGLILVVADVVTGTCTIRRPGAVKGTFDKTTGTYPVTLPEPHYVGGCLIRPMTRHEREELAAEEPVTGVGYQVVVDLDASTQVRDDDILEIAAIDANGDPMLLDVPLQVRAFVRGSLPWQRDLRCTFYMPKS